MSYDEAKQQHDEQMARVRAALHGEDPREAVIADLRVQLAAALRRAQDAEEGLERSEQLRAAAIERENNAIGERDITRQEARRAEAVLADIPYASLLRFIEAVFMRGQPLQFDIDAVEKWLERNKVRP